MQSTTSWNLATLKIKLYFFYNRLNLDVKKFVFNVSDKLKINLCNIYLFTKLFCITEHTILLKKFFKINCVIF